MKRFKSILARILLIVFVYSVISSSFIGIFAEAAGVTVIVESFENGALTFRWSRLPGARAAVVSYHKPRTDNTAELVTSDVILDENSTVITDLKSDYIYDINVALYSDIDESGNLIGEPMGRGILYYLPSITFRSSSSDQAYVNIPGGGREIGSTPKLKLEWKIPKAFYDPDNKVWPDDPDSGNNVFVEANRSEVLEYMQDSLNTVYSDGREISALDFRINISTEINLLNSGSSQASIIIDQNVSVYSATVSGYPGRSAEVSAPNGQGYVSFELWGRADEESSVPDPQSDNVLQDEEIFPGTVYYMNIKPVYKDSLDKNVAAVTVGKPEDQNGSLLWGERSYTSTPIRFQLTKDSANNIYVKIFKINQGSLDLPRLFYEVQASDDPSLQRDWVVKKTIDDTYFSGDSAVTVITGVNPNNEVYYKIVVKSDSPDDRLESLPMPYVLTTDTSRPPLPTGAAVVDRALKTGQVTTPQNTEITVKSTDITISWDKPLDWNNIKDDIYYHFLINTNQTKIAAPIPLYVNGEYWGSYPADYRLVKYISAASDNIKEVGSRLSYTIRAFDLFKWEGDTPDIGGDIAKDGDYPTFLIPNTVYYLQMYTTKEADRGTADRDKMSDISVITSFTTLSGVELDVPLPMSFSQNANGKDTSAAPPVNYIELKFDKVTNIDWNNYYHEFDQSKYNYNIYYDIYMNTRTDTPFRLIGTTEDLNADVAFIGADDIQSSSVIARVSEFTDDSTVNLFGYNLLPNTTYYFKARTRLTVENTTGGSLEFARESIDTAILPITTVVLEVTPPDDSRRKPLAPTDFSIALDDDYNLLLSGSSVTFTWKHQEDDVIYQLIRTGQKVNPTDEAGSYNEDPEYESFLQEYDVLSDGVDNELVYLDPAPGDGAPAHPGKFTYDSATKTCTYIVDRRMFPNKLYYFSLKAVRINSREPLSAGSESVWVSIPVTTSLIDPPLALEVVLNAELGFYWSDDTPGLTAEDYRIYTKGPSDADYKLMTRSQSTVVKDPDGETYYGRITGLETNSFYDIRVVKGINTIVFDKSGIATRDSFHEIEVRWRGTTIDNYSGYEIAIMAEGGSEYTILTASDLEQYVDKDGSILPYYTEETASTVLSDDIYCHARIKSANVVLAGGLVAKQQLRSNVKYYIKVRAVKIDPTETDFIAYSKYTGPVDTRTEFNQDDYDDTDREEQEKAEFLDRMEQLEKGYYWRIAIGNSTASRILLKGDRVADAIRNSPEDVFVVDMTEIPVNINADEIYVPVSVIRIMNTLGRSLIIRTKGAELMLRPSTLDAAGDEKISGILRRQEVRDVYLRMSITRSGESSPALPSGYLRTSDINELDINAVGLSVTDGYLKQLFHNKLYNEDSGLVSEKLNMLLNAYVGSGSEAAALITQYTQSLIDMIEKELSDYIHTTLGTVKLNYTETYITDFEVPASINLSFDSTKGVKLPYVMYDGSQGWQKISSGTTNNGYVRLDIIKTGKYVIMSAQGNIGDIPSGHWAEGYIKGLASRYDLSDVFQGVNNSFMPDNYATSREVVLLYEKVTGKTQENAGLDIRRKNAKLGLSSIISPNSLMRNVKRQETAAILLKLFSVKKGAETENIIPGGRVWIADVSSIGDDYYSSVLVIVDMDVMSLDENGGFHPDRFMTRAEVAAAFVKLLEITGELS